MKTMSKFILSVLLCLDLLSLFAFSQTDAEKALREHHGNIPDCLELGEYVFFHLRGTWDEDSPTNVPDADEFSAIQDALENYIGTIPDVKNAPFCEKLAKFIEPEVTYHFSSVATCTVRSERSANGFDMIIACDRTALEEVRENVRKQIVARENRTDTEWALLLSVVYHESDKTTRQSIHTLLGCPLVNVILREDAQPGQKISGCEASWQEVEDFLQLAKGGSSFMEAHPELCCRMRFKDQLFFPSMSEDDNGKFNEAKVLFRKGKNLPQILQLLCDSIAVSPFAEEKWRYLGGALLANNQPKEAAFAYIQALRLLKENPQAWKGLLNSCQKAGWMKNAEGLRWWLLMEI